MEFQWRIFRPPSPPVLKSDHSTKQFGVLIKKTRPEILFWAARPLFGQRGILGQSRGTPPAKTHRKRSSASCKDFTGTRTLYSSRMSLPIPVLTFWRHVAHKIYAFVIFAFRALLNHHVELENMLIRAPKVHRDNRSHIDRSIIAKITGTYGLSKIYGCCARLGGNSVHRASSSFKVSQDSFESGGESRNLIQSAFISCGSRSNSLSLPRRVRISDSLEAISGSYEIAGLPEYLLDQQYIASSRRFCRSASLSAVCRSVLSPDLGGVGRLAIAIKLSLRDS